MHWCIRGTRKAHYSPGMDNLSGLALARIAFGTAAWVAPHGTLKVAGVPIDSPRAPYLSRMFGAREVALGAMQMLASGDQRDALIKVGIAVDASDAVAGLLTMRGGAVSKPKALLLGAVAASAVVTGVLALQD